MNRMDNSNVVKQQYATTANLENRISLHEKYSTSEFGWWEMIYTDTLADARMTAVRVVEENDKETMRRDCEFSSKYYAPCKAKKFTLSIIIKARIL